MTVEQYQVDLSLSFIFVMLVSCCERAGVYWQRSFRIKQGNLCSMDYNLYHHSLYSTLIEIRLFQMFFSQLKTKFTAYDNIYLQRKSHCPVKKGCTELSCIILHYTFMVSSCDALCWEDCRSSCIQLTRHFILLINKERSERQLHYFF